MAPTPALAISKSIGRTQFAMRYGSRTRSHQSRRPAARTAFSAARLDLSDDFLQQSSRLRQQTHAPRRANSTANARPIPDDAPVIKASLPDQSIKGFRFQVSVKQSTF